MSVSDTLLFIDANKYLDLYRIDQGKKLLAPLAEQVDYIFVTQQIVNEVQRNKIKVAAEFLKMKSQALKLQTFNVPDHLSGTSMGQDKNILQQMREVVQKTENINSDVNAFATAVMEQISCSKDEVSKALAPIFANAVAHSPQEMQRARDRRELGNPPGKSNDPIGDQLAWEQILTRFKNKKRLWIISGDSDYGTIYNKKGFLNPFLYDELCAHTPSPEVYLFTCLIEGLNHFVEMTGVEASQRLTPEDTEEIKKEEQSLLYLAEPTELMRQKMADSLDPILRANELMRQKIAADLDPILRANELMRQKMATDLDPILRANELMRQKMADSLDPILRANELMRQKMADSLDPILRANELMRQKIAADLDPILRANELMRQKIAADLEPITKQPGLMGRKRSSELAQKPPSPTPKGQKEN
jgi:PIN domain